MCDSVLPGDGARRLFRLGEAEGLRPMDGLLVGWCSTPLGEEPFLWSSEVRGCRPPLRCAMQFMLSISCFAGWNCSSHVSITISIGGGGEGSCCSSQ